MTEVKDPCGFPSKISTNLGLKIMTEISFSYLLPRAPY